MCRRGGTGEVAETAERKGERAEFVVPHYKRGTAKDAKNAKMKWKGG